MSLNKGIKFRKRIINGRGTARKHSKKEEKLRKEYKISGKDELMVVEQRRKEGRKGKNRGKTEERIWRIRKRRTNGKEIITRRKKRK